MAERKNPKGNKVPSGFTFLLFSNKTRYLISKQWEIFH